MIQGNIIQGTTPELTFSLPMSISIIKDIRISFEQKEKLIFTKKLSDCHVRSNNEISVDLTQADTFALDEQRGRVTVIVRILTNNDKVVIAEEVYLMPKNIGDKVVMY